MAKEQPFRAPLRQAGQSAYEELSTFVDEQILFNVMAALVVALLAAFEWARWYFHVAPHPVVATIVAATFGASVIIRMPKRWRMARALRLGEMGERMVGQELERLRGLGYEVIHDVIGDGFNIDHVLIGPGGVFTVETKARSKPKGGVVEYRGDVVTVAGHTPDRDPIAQANAQADWVSALLKRGAGMDVKVRPVVLFPGWYVEGSSSGRDVWVLNENSFRKFIKAAHERLSDDEVRRAALALETYVRSRA